jgi:hypothetical protein
VSPKTHAMIFQSRQSCTKHWDMVEPSGYTLTFVNMLTSLTLYVQYVSTLKPSSPWSHSVQHCIAVVLPFF